MSFAVGFSDVFIVIFKVRWFVIVFLCIVIIIIIIIFMFHTEYYYRWYCCFPEHQATSHSLRCPGLCAESLLWPASKPCEVNQCSHAVLSYYTTSSYSDNPKRSNYNYYNYYYPISQHTFQRKWRGVLASKGSSSTRL